MKNFLSLVLASALGAVMTVGIIDYNNRHDLSPSHAFNQNPELVHQVSNTATPVVMPFDFVTASENATHAVVHIFAEESATLAQQRNLEQRNNRRTSPRQDFFQDFFGIEDFFGGGFGGGIGDNPFFNGYSQPKSGTGSGVIISEDGYIVTNNHVVGYADIIEVTLNDGRKLKAEKIGTDPSTDLAVLKIEESDLPTLSYANSDQVKVGEWALAVGNPFDLSSTVTAGIISAKGRDLNLIKGDKSIEEFIQTDAAVNPGNSGGALVNTKGELIGINTAIATPTGVYAGYSFAIPSNLVNRIVEDIIENGNIERASLGIGGETLDKELIEEFNLKVNNGIYIGVIDKGSAAQFAGLLPGDVIIAINDKSIETFNDLVDEMKFAKVGDTLKVKIDRDGAKKTIDVKLRKKI